MHITHQGSNLRPDPVSYRWHTSCLLVKYGWSYLTVATSNCAHGHHTSGNNEYKEFLAFLDALTKLFEYWATLQQLMLTMLSLFLTKLLKNVFDRDMAPSQTCTKSWMLSNPSATEYKHWVHWTMPKRKWFSSLTALELTPSLMSLLHLSLSYMHNFTHTLCVANQCLPRRVSFLFLSLKAKVTVYERTQKRNNQSSMYWRIQTSSWPSKGLLAEAEYD